MRRKRIKGRTNSCKGEDEKKKKETANDRMREK